MRHCGGFGIHLVDGEGFEPSVPMKAHTLSKRAHSTTLPPIRRKIESLRGNRRIDLRKHSVKKFKYFHGAKISLDFPIQL